MKEMNSKVFLVHVNKGYQATLENLIDTQRIDGWFFLGRNAILRHQIEETIDARIERIDIAKKLSESQYNNLNDYLDFIDHTEKNTDREHWWSSYLSWKNPWISLFYLRFTQLDVFKKIICENAEKRGNILVFIEEYIQFKTISSFCKSINQIKTHVYSSRGTSLKFKRYVKGYLKRILNLYRYGFLLRFQYKRIFKSNLFSFVNSKRCNIVVLPTFIDERSFRSGEYRDSFWENCLRRKYLPADMLSSFR